MIKIVSEITGITLWSQHCDWHKGVGDLPVWLSLEC